MTENGAGAYYVTSKGKFLTEKFFTDEESNMCCNNSLFSVSADNRCGNGCGNGCWNGCRNRCDCRGNVGIAVLNGEILSVNSRNCGCNRNGCNGCNGCNGWNGNTEGFAVINGRFFTLNARNCDCDCNDCNGSRDCNGRSGCNGCRRGGCRQDCGI